MCMQNKNIRPKRPLPWRAIYFANFEMLKFSLVMNIVAKTIKDVGFLLFVFLLFYLFIFVLVFAVMSSQSRRQMYIARKPGYYNTALGTYWGR